MAADDDIAVLVSARAKVLDSAAELTTAVHPLLEVPHADTDAVMQAVERLRLLDDDLAASEEFIHRSSDDE